MEDDIEELKKQIAFLRINAQVCYTLIPPILMSIKTIAIKTGDQELLKEIRQIFEASLDHMLFQDVTKDKSYEIAQSFVSQLLSED